MALFGHANPARCACKTKRKTLDAKCRCPNCQISSPNCGHDLEQSIGRLKSAEHMQCSGCGIGINIDTDRLANAADEIGKAIGRAPPEITIKFFR